MTFERDPDNGYLVGPDGCHYEHEWEVHYFAVLGMCGCGDPEGAYEFLKAVLRLCDRRAHLAGTGEWISLEYEVTELVRRQPEMTAHVLLHLLSDKDVIEHGGSVGGSWLTKKGEAIVDLK